MPDEEHASDGDKLYAFVADADVACPNCEYNLRGLREDRCPECGLDLELRVNLVEPKVARLVLAMIGLSLSLGFSGLFFVLFVMAWAMKGVSVGPPPGFYWMCAFFISVTVIGLLSLWFRRSKVRQLSNRLAYMLVAICWAVPLANLAWVFLVVD